jgi:hypothetical protein
MKLTALNDFCYLYFKLFGTCLIYSNIYPILGRLLSYNSSYVNLASHRKSYVIKNVLKTIMMMYLCIITFPMLGDIIGNKYLDMDIIRNWGILYVANDITGLIMVEKLPINTIQHHLMSFFLIHIIFLFDGNDIDIIRFVLVYTIFSYFSFLVNLYLGCRFLVLDINENYNVSLKLNRCIDVLRHLAYYNYSISLLCNLVVHLYYGLFIISSYSCIHLLYLCFLVPIVRDDMILLGWLKNNSIQN